MREGYAGLIEAKFVAIKSRLDQKWVERRNAVQNGELLEITPPGCPIGATLQAEVTLKKVFGVLLPQINGKGLSPCIRAPKMW